MLLNHSLSMVPEEATADSVTPDAVCFGRVGLLEFGPFTLPELAELTASRSLPEDLELRINSDDLWWSWPRIVAGADADTTSPSDCFGNWFTRIEDAIAGPLTIADLSTLLLSGGLPSTVEVQVGDGPWRPVIELLVPAEAPVVIAATDQLEPTPAQATVGEPIVVDPTLVAADRQKVELEVWLAKTMPQRTVTVTVSARPPAKPLEEVIAAAMSRVAVQVDDAARELSYPWLWGSLAVLVLASLFFIWRQPRGPDELELTALRKLKSSLEAIQAVRASQPDEAAWSEFGRALQEDLDVLRSELAQAKRADTPIKESLYWALEYRLPRILAEGRLKPCPSEREFQENLREAERHLRPGAR